MTTKRFVLSLALLLPALAGANEEIEQLTATRTTGDVGATTPRYSSLAQIDKSNVGASGGVDVLDGCAARSRGGRSSSAARSTYTRCFEQGVFRSTWRIGRSTDVRAEQNADTIPVMCCDTVNRGLAYGDGKIFAQADTALVALDAKTGQVAWTVKNGEPARGETNTNAPLVVKDKVITGISGGEYGVRGFVIAYDLKTGRQVWKAYSVCPDSDLLVDPRRTTHLGRPIGANSSVSTWEGEQWRLGGDRGAGSRTTRR
jgi:glucose dehydrogenase